MNEVQAYFRWHYQTAVSTIIKIWRNYLLFAYHFFSVSQLLYSLFAPWKRESLRVENLFPLGRFIEVTTFNLVSRVIGASIRLVTLLLAGNVFIVIFLVGSGVLLLWLFLPIFTLPLYLWSLRPSPLDTIKDRVATMRDLYRALFRLPASNFILQRLNLDRESLAKEMNKVYDAALPETLASVDTLPQAYFLLARSWEPLVRYLQNQQLTAEDILAVSEWYEEEAERSAKVRRFWELDNLLKIPGIGATWAYGYTANLDRYAVALLCEDTTLGPVLGREQELKDIEEILAKTTHHSLLLIGDAGIGKLPILTTLGSRLSAGVVYPTLRHKRLLQLSLSAIIKDAAELSNAKGLVRSILLEAARAGNIILVIDNIAEYLGASASLLDLSAVLAEALGHETLQIIGTTTVADYHRYLVPNTTISPYFEVVMLSEPDPKRVLTILEQLAPTFEREQQVFVTYQALKETIATTSHLLPDIPYPEKAIRVLDKAIVHAKTIQTNIILAEHIDQIVSSESRVPTGALGSDERLKLENLETLLHTSVINQDEAIATISSAMRRGRTGLKESGKPIGSFLFLGPTGVGKTATAKALAQIYFESSEALIRFDMSEYQSDESVDRLIGSNSTPGLLAVAVRDKPYAVLLLDEFEKASNKIHNLFLTIFDEGYFVDSLGKKILCDNLIIIATSNAGAEFIREQLTVSTAAKQELSPTLTKYVLERQIFSPELINRFDAVVIYQPLTPEHLWQIARLLLTQLNKQLKERYDVTLAITDELLEELVNEGYTPEFGARPMKRVIQEKVADAVAQKILREEVQRGETLKLTLA